MPLGVTDSGGVLRAPDPLPTGMNGAGALVRARTETVEAPLDTPTVEAPMR